MVYGVGSSENSWIPPPQTQCNTCRARSEDSAHVGAIGLALKPLEPGYLAIVLRETFLAISAHRERSRCRAILARTGLPRS